MLKSRPQIDGARRSVGMKRLFAAAALAVAYAVSGSAHAVELDVMLSNNQRHSLAAAECPALVKAHRPRNADQAYVHGLCLLYGVGLKRKETAALAELKDAAGNGSVEAALALGDILQDGPDGDRIAASVWYLRAAREGDARGETRYDRLMARLGTVDAVRQASTDLPMEPPPGSIVDPGASEMPALLRQGYHCHFMRAGHKWCHKAVDGL